MMFRHRVCAYAQYRQMFRICIDATYADVKDMRMLHLCRCQAYGYVSPIRTSLLFTLRSEKTQFRIWTDSSYGRAKGVRQEGNQIKEGGIGGAALSRVSIC